MPQAERSRNIMELLKWVSSKENGATTAALIAYARNEITQLGATNKTIQNYITALEDAGLMEYDHPFWQTTKAGQIFLERHGV
jgi:predicted transcriptional regulator